MDLIINFLLNISLSDYLILGFSLTLGIIFLIVGVEKVYRIYLGLIIGLCTFFIINLIINNMNETSELSNISNFILNHKIGLLELSLLFIPIFTILLPFNTIVTFRINKNPILNYIISFFFGIFFISFYLSIFLSIVNNKFLFTLNQELLTILQNNHLVNIFLDFFKDSKIFQFISIHDSIINLVIIVFIFYKMTIGGIIDFILGKFLDLLIKLRNNNSQNLSNEDLDNGFKSN